MPVPTLLNEQCEVPVGFETTEFRVRPLRVEDSPLDYEAVVESRELLRRLFGREWPRNGFTLEENTQDLIKHEQEHEARVAFTYTVISPDETRVLGCIYVEQSGEPDYDARVRMWVRRSELACGLGLTLYDRLTRWMSESWPFERVVYPGR